MAPPNRIERARKPSRIRSCLIGCGGLLLLFVGGCVAFGWITQEIRHMSVRLDAASKLRQIAIAARLYEAQYHVWPQDISSADGRPLLSWRVRLLPLLDEEELYRKFKLDEPWNSPHNSALVDSPPYVLSSFCFTNTPRGNTCALAVKGRRSYQSAHGVVPLEDEAQETISFVVVDDAASVPWSQPEDFEVDLDHPRQRLHTWRGGIIMAALADDDIVFIPPDYPEVDLRKLFTADGRSQGEAPIEDRSILPSEQRDEE